MLWVLCKAANRHPIEALREWRGGEFRRRVRALSYESLWRRPRLPAGRYVFADLDILPPKLMRRAVRAADQLRARRVILNDPVRFLGRFELQQALHSARINPFRVHRSDVHPATLRWPVFVRSELDHAGPRSELLFTSDELASSLGARRHPETCLVVEFEETRTPDGIYRKFAACRVGDRVFARHQLSSRAWMVKVNAPSEEKVQWERLLEEEREYVRTFPDQDEVRAIFELAGIDYGRMDYARVDGAIRVWEINSNPSIVTAATLQMEERRAMNLEVIARHCDAMLELAD